MQLTRSITIIKRKQPWELAKADFTGLKSNQNRKTNKQKPQPTEKKKKKRNHNETKPEKEVKEREYYACKTDMYREFRHTELQSDKQRSM